VTDTPAPKASIRRFDVFAEYSKLEALRDGRPLDEAKGHGLWVAKVVAARRFGPSRGSGPPPGPRGEGGQLPHESDEDEKFRSLSGEVQTDDLFDREVIHRMGERFYEDIFAPTIKAHFDRGDSYQGIRDFVRKDWKPRR
jgi:hypothetical protein